MHAEHHKNGSIAVKQLVRDLEASAAEAVLWLFIEFATDSAMPGAGRVVRALRYATEAADAMIGLGRGEGLKLLVPGAQIGDLLGIDVAVILRESDDRSLPRISFEFNETFPGTPYLNLVGLDRAKPDPADAEPGPSNLSNTAPTMRKLLEMAAAYAHASGSHSEQWTTLVAAYHGPVSGQRRVDQTDAVAANLVSIGHVQQEPAPPEPARSQAHTVTLQSPTEPPRPHTRLAPLNDFDGQRNQAGSKTFDPPSILTFRSDRSPDSEPHVDTEDAWSITWAEPDQHDDLDLDDRSF